jgi:hypothetical protein
MTTRGHDHSHPVIAPHAVIATHPVIATQGVIARNEAIHSPLHNGMDCHVSARLAMTNWRSGVAMT